MSKTNISFADWEFFSTDPGKYTQLSQVNNDSITWLKAIVPGTVAQSLGLTIEDQIDLDKFDWWYRSSFQLEKISTSAKYIINFEGLASLVEVWINEELILTSKNMFVGYECDISKNVKENNKIEIRFCSLNKELEIKKIKPKWKTSLVNHQNLRFFRTAILGRIPAWSPAIHPIGPWRNISLSIVKDSHIKIKSLMTSLKNQVGVIEFAADVEYLGEEKIQSAILSIGDKRFNIPIIENSNRTQLEALLEFENPELWWPHTHGTSKLYDCGLEVKLNNQILTLNCGKIGFKSIELNRADGEVEFIINGESVFCRGACWTINDFISLDGTIDDLHKVLTLAKECGLNMLRIGGTMVYESNAFYEKCDELGILVWQDFMFANMDYPVNDSEFKKEIEIEVDYQLTRLKKYICISVFCGGSEVQQQAAMMGRLKDEWSNEFFDLTIPNLIKLHHLNLPYFASSPVEGPLPFHLSEGVSHYYGVGAYRREISDVKHAKVKFAAECLGFSNIPEEKTILLLGLGTCPAPHTGVWKKRVARDFGSGYDFEDVRDHYLKLLFNLDPVELRMQDLNRYYQISKIVSGEVMRRVFAEWRCSTNKCNGALIWFFKDFWPGAGWGIIDSELRVKAVYYDLKRAWSKVAVLITDEGLDGLNIHIINETAYPLESVFGIKLFSNQRIQQENIEIPVKINPRDNKIIQSDKLIGHFTDLTAAYRFGANKYDLAWAYLKSADDQTIISESFYFPVGLNFPIQNIGEVKMSAIFISDNEVLVEILSPHFLQSLNYSCAGFNADDNYFHLAPNQMKKLIFRLEGESLKNQFKAEFTALNLRESIIVRATLSI